MSRSSEGRARVTTVSLRVKGGGQSPLLWRGGGNLLSRSQSALLKQHPEIWPQSSAYNRYSMFINSTNV